jgi:hypothetical protein
MRSDSVQKSCVGNLNDISKHMDAGKQTRNGSTRRSGTKLHLVERQIRIMVAKYRLHRDTYGFIESAKQVVTIPTGAIVTLTVREDTPVRLCTVAWDGKVLEAFREDVQRNGTMISQTSVG